MDDKPEKPLQPKSSFTIADAWRIIQREKAFLHEARKKEGDGVNHSLNAVEMVSVYLHCLEYGIPIKWVQIPTEKPQEPAQLGHNGYCVQAKVISDVH